MANKKERNIRDHAAAAHGLADHFGLTDPDHADLQSGDPRKTGHHIAGAVGSGLKATTGFAKTGIMIAEGITVGSIMTGVVEGVAVITELVLPHIEGLPNFVSGATGNVGLDIAIDAGLALAGIGLTVFRTGAKVRRHVKENVRHAFTTAKHVDDAVRSAGDSPKWVKKGRNR